MNDRWCDVDEGNEKVISGENIFLICPICLPNTKEHVPVGSRKKGSPQQKKLGSILTWVVGGYLQFDS